MFSVNADGYITVVKADIDYENPQLRNFSMQITVKEQNDPNQSGSNVFVVQVLDINDNSPQFEKPSYVVSIDPGSPPQTVSTVSTHRLLVYLELIWFAVFEQITKVCV